MKIKIKCSSAAVADAVDEDIIELNRNKRKFPISNHFIQIHFDLTADNYTVMLMIMKYFHRGKQ